MKEILKQYAAYNMWGNERLLKVVAPLSADKQQQNVASSFSSLHKTFSHMWDAESIWWQRMKLQEQITLASATPGLSFSAIAAGLSQLDRQWLEWISESTEAALEHVLAYQNSKKEQFMQPIFQMLLHIFNHATYHRGQVANVIHQLQVAPIPATDFIVWSRKK